MIRGRRREEEKRRVCFIANLLILHIVTATGQRIVSRAEIRIYMTNHRQFDSSHLLNILSYLYWAEICSGQPLALGFSGVS